jgi:serine/threonine-protein kinase
LVSSQNRLFAGAWTPDGNTLIYVESPPTEYDEIRMVRLPGERRSEPLIRTRSDVATTLPALSHDGRWLAFVSFETGRAQIYVQPFPGPGPRRQITVDGGREPIWRRDGHELFYRGTARAGGGGIGDGFVVLPFDAASGVPTGNPVLLFQFAAVTDTGAPSYDVTANGEKFVVITPSEEERSGRRNLHVVLNWSDELARRVPTSK